MDRFVVRLPRLRSSLQAPPAPPPPPPPSKRPRAKANKDELDRFLGHAEDFKQALRELRCGEKESHWMWFVFPQLSGMGSSLMALKYGLADVAEAEAFLAKAETRNQLLLGLKALLRHRYKAKPRLNDILQSAVDTKKLVSCVTLFVRVAEAGGDREVRELCQSVLEWAEEQGWAACQFTSQHLSLYYAGAAL
ncbi:hypothetical protein BASA81_006868 [Batrachochytrium salamandrivorans]|nr:hypothetical protein BASA81_006868 [Batrachochytrium salamandrivorans]